MQFYRRSIRIHGVVQGVGFRPHVARVAAESKVTGHCGNDENGVFIEAQGADAAQVDRFVEELVAKLPPLARIVRMHSETIAPVADESAFRIVASRHSPGARSLIPPDVAMCPDCLAEFNDPENRRYHYPFISCTHCGPRLSIIEELPYDRPNTTMREFPLCEPCHSEYTDPADRRFHAQPVSCFDCGPSLWLEESAATHCPSVSAALAGKVNNGPQTPARTPQEMAEVFTQIHALLDDGCILAVKGIGGFHLVCDATNDRAVGRLRKRKRRPHKPFAVMVANVGVAKQLVQLTRDEEDLLTSPECPIVIAPKGATTAVTSTNGNQQAGAPQLSELIAPGLGDVGVLLPYSGLHMLLVDRPLVVTSGNISGEPVCYTNAQAREKLAHLADVFVMHDRGIVVPVEDSVFVSTLPSRRARGFAPLPIAAPAVPMNPSPSVAPTILATGGELKNTFALAQGDVVHVSSHIGDMGSLASQQAYRRAVDQLTSMRGAEPEAVVCDLHPNYATTAFAERFADERGLPLFQVQHHWAHALSLLAEHQIAGERAIVAALDGTGYGTDGTVWGGEILDVSATNAEWSRVWHVPHFPIVGGDRAVIHPWRLAAGIAHAWGLPEVMDLVDELVSSSGSGNDIPTSAAEFSLVHSQLESGFGAVQTSSLGRVFDAAAALIVPDLGLATTYEAQGPMMLEHLAREYLSYSQVASPGHVRLPETSASTIPELFAELFAPEHFQTRPLGLTAALLHDGLARIIADQLVAQARSRGIELVGVTGGCALNRLLVGGIRTRVTGAGLRFLEHTSVPANDGGLSLGQAIAGRLLLRLRQPPLAV